MPSRMMNREASLQGVEIGRRAIEAALEFYRVRLPERAGPDMLATASGKALIETALASAVRDDPEHMGDFVRGLGMGFGAFIAQLPSEQRPLAVQCLDGGVGEGAAEVALAMQAPRSDA